MKLGSIICLTLFLLAVVLGLAQMWFQLFPAALFSKIILTLGVLFVGALGTTLVVHEYIQNKQMKDSGHLD